MENSYEFGTKGWLRENERRQKLMDIWYIECGRQNKDHPNHATYTGLAKEANCRLSQDLHGGTRETDCPTRNN
jgi:hypothetical protein